MDSPTRRSLHSLLRPRHLAASLVVFLFFGGAAGVLLGYANAGGTTAATQPAQTTALPADITTLTLPAPHVGDHGVYTMYSLARPAANARVEAQEAIEFRWLDDVRMQSRDGLPIWANHVLLNETRDGQGREDSMYVAGGTSDSFASEGMSQSSDSGPWPFPLPVSDASTHTERDVWYMPPPSYYLPCGLRNPFQGATKPLAHAIDDAFACRQLPNQPHTTDVQFRNGTLEDAFVHFEWWYALGFDDGSHQAPTKGGDFWFRPDLPYPVRMEFDGYRGFNLTSLVLGKTPIRLAAETGSAPALQMAAFDSDGPDESGIPPQPFPLSKAFATARDDPSNSTLRNYLANHPKAVMVWARHASFPADPNTMPQQATERWSFGFSDGGPMQVVGIEWTSQQYGPVRMPDKTSYVSPDYPVDGMIPIPPSELPAKLPTVASMWAQWATFAPADMAPKANDWGFMLAGEPQLSKPVLQVWAGYFQYVSNSSSLDPLDYRGAWRELTTTWTVTGQVEHVLDTTQTSNTRIGPSPPGGTGVQAGSQPNGAVPPAPLQPLSSAPQWLAPSLAQSATVGAGAAVVGLLYWLWPGLKPGLVGLFSRVHRSDLLDNPLRAELVERIGAQPGIHQQELVRAVGRGNGSVEHHLEKLVEAGLVARVPGQGYTCYFPPGKMDHKLMAAAPLLKSPVARAILKAAANEPGVSSSVLAQRLSVSAPTVHYHVSRLAEAGLVAGTREGNRLLLRATSPGLAAAGAA
jgi:DNA-binding transcriptional ArsR family regulator